MQDEIERNQELQRQKVTQQQVDDAVANSTTAEELRRNAPAKDATTPAQKAALRKRYEELTALENAAKDKFLDERREMSLEDQLADLKKIDSENLSPTEAAGLVRAIDQVQRQIEAQKAEGPQDPSQQRAEEMQEAGVDETVEDAHKLEDRGGVEATSADGREFQIDGKKFFNRRTNPLDAIDRTRDGKIKSVALFDEAGNRHVIWGPPNLSLIHI